MESFLMLLLALHWVSLNPASAVWCYTEPDCGPLTWDKLGFCNGSRQSPVNITEELAVFNSNLTAFTFTGYGNTSKLLSLTNLGHTVQVELDQGVSITGGSLSVQYSAIALHFHWGNGSSNPGSEHRLNGKQFPMEMHIVHTKQGLTLAQAKNDTTGIAVLGFFINVSEESTNATGFETISKLLSNVTYKNDSVQLNGSLSIESLLQGVNLTSYYRYLGSLTTPTCDEAVVWTVFKNPILVPSNVVGAFSSRLYESDHIETPIANVFRTPKALGVREVQTSVAKGALLTTATPVTLPGRGTSLFPPHVLALLLAFLTIVKGRG
ncbi:carbonic anhydrase 4-like isoform X1 [Pleurodeles waltl]|uniref:carbonic anhydrase 4-like isoform X1 n=1 Tax=Pleurodeles waltl TaxID=8319 RepID=UPI003709BFA8